MGSCGFRSMAPSGASGRPSNPDRWAASTGMPAGSPVDPGAGLGKVADVDRILVDYFAAWNETNVDERRQLLQRSVSDDAEVIDPTGRWQGLEGLSERIANYHAAAPGTAVVAASGVDSHNNVERYGWKIVDSSGNEVMEGVDIAERDADGRLQRIVMFHGPLPAAE
jgi:hypothetical protein